MPKAKWFEFKIARNTMNENKPLVSIKCTVYNHEPYLRQCLDGFVMQKTNFSFEAIVHDDASTDGSAAIIREYAEKYPDIIKPIYETENQYSKKDGSLGRIMNAAVHPKAKYIALCEGDDYWIDPLKLQKQVDILEATQASLVYSLAKVYNEKSGQMSNMIAGLPYVDVETLILRNPIPTLTALMRKDVYFRYRQEFQINPNWKMGDFPMWIWIAIHGKILFMNEITGVYRVLENSASHSVDSNKTLMFQQSVLDIQLYFIHHYIKSEKLATACKLNFYKNNRAVAFASNQKIAFFKEASSFYNDNHYILPSLFSRIYMKCPFLFFLISKLEGLYWRIIKK